MISAFDEHKLKKLGLRHDIPHTRKCSFMHFTRKIKSIPPLQLLYWWCSNFSYDYGKYVGIMLDSKLYFHQHTNFTSSHALQLIGINAFYNQTFSSVDRITVLYGSYFGHIFTPFSPGIISHWQILMHLKMCKTETQICATADFFSQTFLVIMIRVWNV
jgi:hypothetical protein